MNGQDSFEHVVDRLCEAEKRAATAQEASNGSQHQIAALQQELRVSGKNG